MAKICRTLQLFTNSVVNSANVAIPCKCTKFDNCLKTVQLLDKVIKERENMITFKNHDIVPGKPRSRLRLNKLTILTFYDEREKLYATVEF
jgi:hypothetical protein